MIPKMEIRDLCYSYHSMDGEIQALSDISFTVNAGEFLAVVGPSGCGKSTLLSLMTGLLTPSKGQVLMDGIPVKRGDIRVGYMLQKDHLFEWRTVFSNACLGLEIQNQMNPVNKDKVGKLLKQYGLDRFSDSRPSELSGGMRQRAALIRTLALEPELLLLDEPFSALDYQTRLTVCDDISMIIRNQKKTAVLVTHDLSEAVSVADRILILTKRPGRIREILTVKFSDHAGSPLMRRNCPEFSSYFNRVWEIMQDHAAGGENI